MSEEIDTSEQLAIEEYEASMRKEYTEHPAYPVMSLLRTGVIYRTSVDGWKGTYESGFIKPNSGDFPYTYEKSGDGYGASLGYVCLFDFESVSESDYVQVWPNWIGFLDDQKPATVFLKLNRAILKAKLIPNLAPSNNSPIDGTLHLPHVEV